MKQLLFLPLYLFLSLCSIAQYDATGLCNESITLNGGIRSQMGGRSRTYIPIKVPEHCNKILISLNINENPYSVNAWGLTTQVLSLLASPGISSITDLVNNISGTNGDSKLDALIYLNESCAKSFVQKVHVKCFNYFERRSTNGGVFQVDIPFPNMTYYLCFRNPESVNAVYFQVEATAIINKEDTIEQNNSTNQMNNKYNTDNSINLHNLKRKYGR